MDSPAYRNGSHAAYLELHASENPYDPRTQFHDHHEWERGRQQYTPPGETSRRFPPHPVSHKS
ncbi:hypothetical protein ANI02nite_33890 [Acetobacter nitrogenifigens DSM 23921 = NBRC 105050]|uniref:Uncharacterized protein n=1 Tax=Acetobacter nitrogenifigens DSM 23921 = NBRC 105050 TaxID=1120919 RepID=A0A511XF28_9PROT|nr:hypothetical protein ANI02nite_33890 [Acetobacter nitrogenifigens DSM 23921 = NBRC 105050]